MNMVRETVLEIFYLPLKMELETSLGWLVAL